jgi:chromosome segregation ATPase
VGRLREELAERSRQSAEIHAALDRAQLELEQVRSRAEEATRKAAEAPDAARLAEAEARAAELQRKLADAEALAKASKSGEAAGQLQRVQREREELLAQVTDRDHRIARLQRELADKTDRLGRLAKEMGDLKARGLGKLFR